MMSKKPRKRRDRSRKPTAPSRATGGVQLVTPEGNALVFANARYQHTASEEIRQILKQAGDFGLDDDLELTPDGAWQFPWFESRSGIRSLFAPVGQRVLATLTLTPTTLEVEAMSQQRLDACRQRLERLLGDRIHLAETGAKSARQALRASKPRAETRESQKEPFIPPPEVVAELEEKMLRQWIDESIPALGGLSPREAVKTPEGRQHVLELIDYAQHMQQRVPKTPGMFAPDYRKVKKMLGLE
jgi:hypothetical protein